MKKLSVISIFSLFFASSVYASEIYYYGGLSTGAAYSQADMQRNLIVDVFLNGSPAGPMTFTSSGDTQRFSGLGGVQLGAGMRFDWAYLGVEALGQFSNGSFDSYDTDFSFIGVPTSITNSQTHLRMRDFEPAIDLKPGIFIKKSSLLYARVGIAFNELKIHDDAYYNLINGIPDTNPAVANIHLSDSETVTGLRLGAGLEHHLFEQFTLFIDYTYTQYGDIQVAGSNHLATSGSTDFTFDLPIDAKASDVNKQTLRIGFNYYL